MKRYGLAFALLAAACSNKPCETSSQCGSSEVCAAAQCQALASTTTFYAIDPSDGSCRPMPAGGNRADVRDWVTCTDPCVGMNENACIADRRCQPGYTTDQGCSGITPDGRLADPAAGGVVAPGSCGGPRTFAGCHANQLRVDPCDGLDYDACNANPQCAGFASGPCGCPADAPCDCGGISEGWFCRVKNCGDYTSADQCNQNPDCTTSAPTPVNFDTVGSADEPFFGCFDKGFGSCFAFDEASCLRHSECHPVGAACYCPPGATCACGGGAFYFCEPDDGVPRCNHDSDCGADQRCSNDEVCAPPIGSVNFGQPGFGGPIPAGGPTTTASVDAPSCAGLCVPKGCTGYGEKHCVADPACEPIYFLNCSPYGGGGGFGGGGPNGCVQGDFVSPGLCGPCEPSFTSCVERQPGSEVDPETSVLERDPAVIDSPAFAFANVMTSLAGKQDAAQFVDSWLGQLTRDLTVDGKLAPSRPNAASYLASLPRLADGRLDLAHLGFQVTSLSNRLDLAGAHDCGEARITYALNGGVTDRTHRMTVIVELRQPDDGSRCQATAQRWIQLSRLKGDALQLGFLNLFGPLLAPEFLNQVRTNEFLTGNSFDPVTGQPTPWELREFHLGDDGLLHLALSKQALDPAQAADPSFVSWVSQNLEAIKQQRAIIPAQFLAVTSSENGSRIAWGVGAADDFQIQQSLNQQACAGCHTTETNSAFAHVGERFAGTGRAKISEFLRTELPKRAQNLWLIGRGQLDQVARNRATLVH